MPLIQRNLFPSRPPLKKCDGPSVLRAANNNGNNNNHNNNSTNDDYLLNRTIINPNLSLFNNNNNNNNYSNGKLYKSSNNDHQSSINNKGNNNNNMINNKKDAKKLRKSHSSSMLSLLYQQQQQPLINDNQILSDTSSDPNSSSSSMDNMMSRRRILSRSRDALNTNTNSSSNQSTSDDYYQYFYNNNCNIDDEDVWYNRKKLMMDHIDEIIMKWNQIDDEIWGKIIYMERNRRIAKAYARQPILKINGLANGFDGEQIGLNGFDNPMRDKKSEQILKNQIQDGVKIFIDNNGNLLLKCLTQANVYIIRFDDNPNADDSNDDSALKIEKINRKTKQSKQLFDMKKFHNYLLQELRSPSSSSSSATMNQFNRRRQLERRCFYFISFGSIDNDLLNLPVWCIIINLVALEMLMKLLPLPSSSNNDDNNFYSLPITISMKNNYLHNDHYQSIPPKLPPRDIKNKNPPLTLPEPDYDDNDDDDDVVDSKPMPMTPKLINNDINNNKYHRSRSHLDDDPYFCGLSAHVSRFNRNDNHVNNNANNRIKMIKSAPLLSISAAATPPPPQQQPPPIIRKAMMQRKLWNNNFNTNNDYNNNNYFNYSPFHRNQPPPPTLPLLSRKNEMFYSTTFDPITMIPQPLPIRHNSNSNNNNNLINDNNEIYGINPSLMQKNKKFQPRSSLKSILFSSHKDKNNNNNNNNNSRRKH